MASTSLLCSYRRFSTARKLIEAGANINALTSNNESIVLLALNHITAKSDETYAFIQYVFKCGFDKELLNERTAKKQTCPLNLAVEKNLPKLVKLLLENGANPNITGLYGISMLYQNLGVIGILNGHKVEQANDKYLADSIRRHSNGGSDIESYKQLQSLSDHDPRKVLFEEVKNSLLETKKFAMPTRFLNYFYNMVPIQIKIQLSIQLKAIHPSC
jgi:ankyrin repeat protein